MIPWTKVRGTEYMHVDKMQGCPCILSTVEGDLQLRYLQSSILFVILWCLCWFFYLQEWQPNCNNSYSSLSVMIAKGWNHWQNITGWNQSQVDSDLRWSRTRVNTGPAFICFCQLNEEQRLKSRGGHFSSGAINHGFAIWLVSQLPEISQ